MVDTDVTIKLDTSQADSQLEALDAKTVKTSKSVNTAIQQTETQIDLMFAKGVMTVQRIQSLIVRTLSIGGKALGNVGQSIMTTVSLAAATLGPLFTAQALSGWQRAQAILGMIELSMAVISLPMLIAETNRAQAWDEAFIRDSNNAWGRQQYDTT